MKKDKVGIVGSIIEGKFANLITSSGVIIKNLTDDNIVPIILPITKNKKIIEELIKKIDYIIFQEGQIISPFIYDENPKIKKQIYLFERDYSELLYLEMAEKYNKNILGINRGAHIINAYFGGSLYQDLEKNIPDGNYHRGTEDYPETYHTVELLKNSKLYEIFEKSKLIVKSNHYQGIKELGNSLSIAAQSDDGIIEAFEGEKILGIQFSMESMEEEYAEKIFRYFIERGGIKNE